MVASATPDAMTPPLPSALTISGSDCSGGAGLQADLKTFHRFGVYGQSVVTLITAQNTRGVSQVQLLDSALVLAQLDTVLSDIRPWALKTGSIGSAALVRALGQRLRVETVPRVVDPVLVSKTGDPLGDADTARAMREWLLPGALLATPNRYELAVLTGGSVERLDQAIAAAGHLRAEGCGAVLLKGCGEQADDWLIADGDPLRLPAARQTTTNLHGTGCTLSAAITARLALGDAVAEAVAQGKAFIARAIATAPGLGQGVGPVNHWA